MIQNVICFAGGILVGGMVAGLSVRNTYKALVKEMEKDYNYLKSKYDNTFRPNVSASSKDISTGATPTQKDM